MVITELNNPSELDSNPKLKEAYLQFEKLLVQLRKRDLPNPIVSSINNDIEELNTAYSGDKLRKMVIKKQAKIIELLEKELKLVTINHYRNYWMALGLAVFGLPFGVVFGASFGNMAFIGIGLPIGLVIGMAVGTGMDKKALEEGRQLDLEINQ